MEKTAQRKSGKRSILNKLREMSNIGGIATEKFFNPEFERVMNSLREADNKIRAVVSGQEIEGEGPGDDSTSLKDLYKTAKSNLNRREYMVGIAFLGRFHKKLHEVVKLIEKLDFDVDQVHNDFLFKDLDDEQKKHLHDLKSRLSAHRKDQLVAEASIMDFLVNVGTERGRALSAWEKRYPKQVGKLKREASSLLQKTESTLNSVISALKEMATARADRKVDDYVKAASKIKNYYGNYDKSFKDFYISNVKNFLEKQELVAPTKTVENNTELSHQEVPVSKNISNTPSISGTRSIPIVVNPTIPSVPDLEVSEDSNMETIPETLRSPDTQGHVLSNPPGTDTVRTPVPQSLPNIPESGYEVTEEEIMSDHNPTLPTPGKAASNHQKFYNTLHKLSNENPLVLAGFIRKYALSIKNIDPETAINLLKVVKSIKE